MSETRSQSMRATSRILVIDDELIVCLSCQTVLVAEGYEVGIALTGEEALRKIKESDYNLALVDLRIPGSGGLGLVRAIRKDSPSTEIIVITGYPSIDNAKESIRLGAFDYLTKPFVPETVCSVVSRALAHQSGMIARSY